MAILPCTSPHYNNSAEGSAHHSTYPQPSASNRRRSHAVDLSNSSPPFVTTVSSPSFVSSTADPSSDLVNLDFEDFGVSDHNGEMGITIEDIFGSSPTSTGMSDHDSYIGLSPNSTFDQRLASSPDIHVNALPSTTTAHTMFLQNNFDPNSASMFTMAQPNNPLTVSSIEQSFWMPDQATDLQGLINPDGFPTALAIAVTTSASSGSESASTSLPISTTTPFTPGNMQRSTSSVTSSSLPHDPWPTEMFPRFGNAGPDGLWLQPGSDHDYAPSVNSIESPQLLHYQDQLSPMRSPVYPQSAEIPVPIIMNKRQISTNSSLSTGSFVDRTQRMQQSFANQQRRRNLSVLSTDSRASAARPMVSSRATSSRASVDNTHSPDPEYVLVATSPATGQSSPSPKPAKRKLSDTDVEDDVNRYDFQSNFVNDDDNLHVLSDHSSNSNVVRKSNGKRAGGRSIGSHLNEESAARAKDLRVKGSCWTCCIQRDSCSNGEQCERCLKRRLRAQMDHNLGIGCDRTKLADLKTYFIPDFVNRTHEASVLNEFCDKHINRWGSVAMNVEMVMITGLPSLACEVYEFQPKTGELLRQFQYMPNPETGEYLRVERASPPLAMKQFDRADTKRYEKYLNTIVDSFMDFFADKFYIDEKDDCLRRLLRLMARLEPDKEEEETLLKDIYKLLVVSHIFGRTISIDPKQKKILRSLNSHSPHLQYADFICPRMANRQLKYLFCAILNKTMESVLKRLQQILRSSKGTPKWTSAFCAILGLAMCFEDMQSTIHCICDSEAAQGLCSEQDAYSRGNARCIAIDEKFQFLTNLFRMKYHRVINPLKDWKDEKVQKNLGPNALDFAKGVSSLIREKYDSYLCDRQHISVSHLNPERYYGRLVSRFLLSFYPLTP